jgi:hypothetical protein
LAASQGDYGVGAPDRPEHAGLLEPGTDHSLASGLDYTRSDKEMLPAKLGVTNAIRVPLEAFRLCANLVGHLGIAEIDGAQSDHELFDFALAEPSRWTLIRAV